jgi:predicted MFS family arabinose efflux permease
MAGGVFGSFLGMALGGVMAEHFGWRWAFGGMAVFGLILAFLYPIVVKENKIGTVQGKIKTQQKQDKSRSPLRSIYSSRSLIATYIGFPVISIDITDWGQIKRGWSRQWWYSVVQLARFYVGCYVIV